MPLKLDEFETLKPPPLASRTEPPSPLVEDTPTRVQRPVPADLTEVGHYRVIRVIGQGGMGKVYQAEDKRLLRLVALKVMLPDAGADAAARDRFLREARTLASVRNDHVVTIFEVDDSGENPFLAMEYLEGQSLEKWLSGSDRPHIGDILRIAGEIAIGLSAAHAVGLIHRDIKPGNIWLQAPSGRVKILDFGLARSVDVDAGLTRLGDILGTPYYMSPEQARGDAVDPRSDLFSMGVVLYQLCTGELPFQGKSVTAVLTALATHQPTAVSSLNPGIPENLSHLVMSLLEKSPDGRPASAEAVRQILAEIEGQLPGEANRMLSRGKPRDAAHTPTLGPAALHKTLPNYPRAVKPGRTSRAFWNAAIAGVLLIATCLGSWLLSPPARILPQTPSKPGAGASEPIRLGLLYSRTGMMSATDRPIHDGVLMAVSEINEAGGLLGRQIEVVLEDAQSDDNLVARKAERLIEQEQVCCVIGCSTSSGRKEAKVVVERHRSLLLYPRSYEGMELSRNIVYGGQVPNQQILPALKWSVGFLNTKRWYLVGSDSFYGRANAEIIRDEAKALGVEIVGEKYCLCGNTEMTNTVRAIQEAKPDLVLNSMVGDSNVAFFRSLQREGNRAEKLPVLSFAISEQDMAGLAPAELEGHYAAGHYFHSIDSPSNRAFLKRVAAKFDAQLIVSSPMQTSYMLVHLWAQAVRAANTTDATAVRDAIPGLPFDAPQGRVAVDAATLHVEHFARVGQCNANGHFEDVFVSPRPIPPQPFLPTRTRPAWEQFIRELHERWGGHWHK